MSQGCRRTSYGLSIGGGTEAPGGAIVAGEIGPRNRCGCHVGSGLGRRSRTVAGSLALGDKRFALGVVFKVRLKAGRAGFGAGAEAVGEGAGIEADTACSSGAGSHEGPDESARKSECIKRSAPAPATPRLNKDTSIAFVEMAPGCAATRAAGAEVGLRVRQWPARTAVARVALSSSGSSRRV